MNIDRKTVQLMNKYAGHEYYILPDLIDDYEDDEIIDFMHKTIIGMEQKLMEEIKDLDKTLNKVLLAAKKAGIVGTTTDRRITQ